MSAISCRRDGRLRRLVGASCAHPGACAGAPPSHRARPCPLVSPQVVHQVSGIRGEVLPAFSVANGAVVEPNFGQTPYAQGMPMGFQGIIKSMSLL